MKSYDEARKKAKAEYISIQQVWCPALGDYVIFSSNGFRHLIRDGKKYRHKAEQKRRFALIPIAKKILEGSQVFARHAINSKEKNVIFWVFMREGEDKTIKVIVRQIEGQKKKFLSVFEKNKKSTHAE